MDAFIEELCDYYMWSFKDTLRAFNNNEVTDCRILNTINGYRVNRNIYKEDMPILCAMYISDEKYVESYEEFMKTVVYFIKIRGLDINNLTFAQCRLI